MLEIMKSAEAMMQLDLSGKMLGSFMVTLLGISVTFCVLFIIMFSVRLMPQQTNPDHAQELSESPLLTEREQATVPPEVAAAIIAAIYALEPSKTFYIKNIIPSPHSPAWTAEGRSEIFSSRKILRK